VHNQPRPVKKFLKRLPSITKTFTMISSPRGFSLDFHYSAEMPVGLQLNHSNGLYPGLTVTMMMTLEPRQINESCLTIYHGFCGAQRWSAAMENTKIASPGRCR
jgi:hypothetical protein